MRVVAAVIRNKDLYLACRRGEHKTLAGKWEFPGGKVEMEETDAEALTRELQEELETQIEVGELIAISSLGSDEAGIEMFSYAAEIVGSSPRVSSDHDKMIWVTIDEMQTLDWAELDIPVVAALAKDYT